MVLLPLRSVILCRCEPQFHKLLQRLGEQREPSEAKDMTRTNDFNDLVRSWIITRRMRESERQGETIRRFFCAVPLYWVTKHPRTRSQVNKDMNTTNTHTYIPDHFPPTWPQICNFARLYVVLIPFIRPSLKGSRLICTEESSSTKRRGGSA